MVINVRKKATKNKRKNAAYVLFPTLIIFSIVAVSFFTLFSDHSVILDRFKGANRVEDTQQSSEVMSKKTEAADLVYDALNLSLRKDRTVSLADTLDKLATPSEEPNFNETSLERLFAEDLDKNEMLISKTVFVTLADQLAPSGKIIYKQDLATSNVYQSKSGSYHVPIVLYTDKGEPPLTVEVIEKNGRLYIDPYSLVHQVKLSAIVGGEAPDNPYIEQN